MPRLVAGLMLFVTAAAAPRAEAQAPVAARDGSAPPAYVSHAPVRSGLSSPAIGGVRRDAAMPHADTNATGVGSVRRRAAHAAIGAGAGLVVGAGVGVLLGYGLDRSDHSDAMVPAALELGAIGAVAGLVIGAVAGALVR